jgi:hypothetical protein
MMTLFLALLGSGSLLAVAALLYWFYTLKLHLLLHSEIDVTLFAVSSVVALLTAIGVMGFVPGMSKVLAMPTARKAKKQEETALALQLAQDKSKQLEAKVTTLETALSKALSTTTTPEG